MKKIGYRWTGSILAVIVSMLLAGCTGQKISLAQKEQLPLPAITKTATGTHYSGKFVWHDLLTDDVSKAKKFYSGLFGWSFKEVGDYTMIYHHGKRIGGMMEIASKTESKDEAVWLPSVSVANVDSAIDYVKSKRGKVIKGPLDMKKRGSGALVSDPHGAHIVLLHAKGGDPVDATAKMGDWLWNELWTNKPKESYAFYRKLGRYDASEVRDSYRILKRKGKWRAGIRDVSKYDAKVHWVPVIRVADPKKITGRVVRLGGKVMMEPHKAFVNGDVAVIVDNTGALFIIQRWTEEGK